MYEVTCLKSYSHASRADLSHILVKESGCILSYYETMDLSNSQVSLSNVIVRHDFIALANTSQGEAFLLKIITRSSTHLEYFVPTCIGL